MATTTNYGWDTPDDTDLVKDGAAAIRTLGSSVDTTTKNLNPQTTTGALAYRSATANVNTALPIGTAGQVLTVAAGVPSWQAPAGNNLNANRTYVTTQESTTSSSYTDLTTSQAVTLTTGTKALVALSCRTLNGSTASINMGISFAVSGATTVTAADQYGTLQFYGAATNAQFAVSSAVVITGLTAGSNTFTMKFKSNGSNSAFFENRNISVVDLGS
jgi:hypothetical protein